MSIFNTILKTKRNDRYDNRGIDQIRCDRNEKVSDWDQYTINKIYKTISKREFTSYFDQKKIKNISIKLAKYLDVSVENFCYFHGGDAVIRDFILFYYKKNLSACINDLNYQMYDIYLNSLKIELKKIKYIYDQNNTNLFYLNKKQFYKTIPTVDIIFFTNPNQVSSLDFNINEFEKILQKWKKKIFFIDESYYGFGHTSLISLTKKYKNIYILRSSTKSFGMAPHRIGFLIGHKDNMKKFKVFQTPYPLSLFSGKILEYFLLNTKLIKKYQSHVKKGRDFFCASLRRKGFRVNNSLGNSINIQFKNKKEMQKKYNLLKKKKITTKQTIYYKSFYLRVTCDKISVMKKILQNF